MKNIFQLIPFSLVILLITSCGPSQRELAVQRINIAKNEIRTGDTLRAIEILDSIAFFYPKAEMQSGVAKNMTKELYRQLIDASTLQKIKNDSVIATLETKFTKEKTEFDKYTQYKHKLQTSSRSWKHSFLQVYLDERGVMYLSSNYMGKKWLKHTGIRVYDGKQQARSAEIPLDDPLNHSSDFLDYKWEKVTYMDGRSDSVIHFIAENSHLNLKCVFLGSRYYYILLEKYDIQAVVDALALSEAIKKEKALEEKIKKLKDRQ